MNRNITNVIRFCMDELLPPIIRDNKYFMYPFFHYAFKGKNIKTMMEFKSLVANMSTEEYEAIYKNLDTLGARRPTDLNRACIRYILSAIEEEDKKIIDIGCGRGYFVALLLKKFPEKEIWGADLLQDLEIPHLNYIQGNIEKLPLEDKSMDVVVCSHVLEHVLDFDKTLKELKRIARKKIIITVPKQRYYYYTLDLHLRFFYKEYELIDAMQMENYEIKSLQGDFVFVGYL